VIKNNSDKLEQYNIELSPRQIQDAYMVIPEDQSSQVISGWLDIPYKGVNSFKVQLEQDDICSWNEHLHKTRLSFWFDENKKITSLPLEGCFTNKFRVRNIVRTPKAIWFVIYQHTPIFDIDTWWTHVEGFTV
jgi:hypothetical protein